MNSSKFPFRVERVGQPGSDYGQHKTREGAEKRIARFVSMSRGKHTREMYTIQDDSQKSDSTPVAS